MFTFRKFVAPQLLLQEMPLRGRITGQGTEMPIPQAVENVINAVSPNIKQYVYRWIMTDGMSQALVNRKKFAEMASEHFGFEITQDAIFSEVAHEQIPELGKIADELERVWFESGYEPEEIDIYERSADPGKASYLNLQDINASLIKAGMEPLYYGGKKGLIEYIEVGDWNTSRYRMRNAPYGKQGHDLSLKGEIPCPEVDESGYHPVRCQRCKGTGKIEDTGEYVDPAGRRFFQFGLAPGTGGFRPPMASKAYYTSLKRGEDWGAKVMLDLVTAHQSGEDIEDRPGPDWVKQTIRSHTPESPTYKLDTVKEPIHAAIGFGPRSKEVGNEEDDAVQIQSQEDWDLLRELIGAAIDAGFQIPWPTGPNDAVPIIALQPPRDVLLTIGGIPVNNYDPRETKEKILNAFFDSKNGTLRRNLRKVWKPGPKDGRKYEAHTLILAGVKLKLKEIAERTPGADTKDLYKRAVTYVTILKGGIRMPVTGASRTQSTNMDQLVQQGWEPMNLTPEESAKFSERIPLSQCLGSRRNVINLRNQTEGKFKKLVKTKGTWSEIQATGSEPIDVEALRQSGYELRSLNRTNTIGSATKGKEEIIIRKGRDGRWYKAVLGEESPIFDPLLGRTRIRGNVGMQPHLDSPDANAEIENWKAHPEEYGDDPWEGGFPLCVRQAIPERKGEFRNEALQKIISMIGAEGFKFGDLRKTEGKFGIKTHLGKVSVPLDGKMQLLSERPEVMDMIIAKFAEILRKNGDVGWHDGEAPFDGQSETFNREIYEAFLQNGKSWRLGIAYSVGRYAGKGYDPERGIGQGGSGTGDDEYDQWADYTRDEREKASDSSYDSEYGEDDDEHIRTKHDRYDDDDEGFVSTGSYAGESDPNDAAADKWLAQQAQASVRGKAPEGKSIGRKVDVHKPRWTSPNLFTGPNLRIDPETRKRDFDDEEFSAPAAPAPAAVAPTPAAAVAAREMPPAQAQRPGLAGYVRRPQRDYDDDEFRKAESTRFASYKDWQETTGVVWGYSRKKANLKPGAGFNVWGEPGSLGTNIGGEVNTVKEDPDGTKGIKHGRKSQAK